MENCSALHAFVERFEKRFFWVEEASNGLLKEVEKDMVEAIREDTEEATEDEVVKKKALWGVILVMR